MDVTAWRTVRVFISSTFRDMQAERDHLVRFVFPRLREELLKRRIHLVDVDLRWGVTSEQDALEVCREIIDECRPRFICILGGRYGWVPPGREHSITADEVSYGVLDRLEAKEHRYFYFRDPEATESIPGEAARAGGYVETDPANARKLADLKQAIADAGLRPFVYSTQWDEASQRLVGMEAFGNRVYADLLASIDDEYGAEAPEALDEFAEEDAAIEAFIEERVERYVVGSRQSVFDELTRFAQADGEPNTVALTGPSGCGKSALLGRFSQDYAREHPGDLVITHFVGASAGSTDLRRALRRLCHALAQAAGDEREIPQDVKELVSRFEELLGQAAQRPRVVLVLDALNQLDATHNAHTMYWLPRSLPANVRVIVSTLRHPALEGLRRRGPAAREIALQPLSDADSRRIIEAVLKRYHKRMSEVQIAALLDKRESGNPLYLLAALEELRTLGTYEEITNRIRELPGEAQPLFVWIIRRLEADPGFRDAEGRPVGPEVVRQFAACLGVSRHGLSHMELAELIAPGDEPDAQGNVAALIRLLRPYLMHRGELLDFYHTQLREAVEGEYLDEEHERLTAHRQLAEYFKDRADPAGDGTWSGGHVRGLSELPYHQTQGEMWAEVEGTLTDIAFVEAKSRANMVYDAIRDCDRAQWAWPGQDEKLREEEARQAKAECYVRALIEYSRDPDKAPLPDPPHAADLAQHTVAQRQGAWAPVERIRAWRSFIAASAQWLGRPVPPAYQLAWNSADRGPVAEAVAQCVPPQKGWLRRQNRPLYSAQPHCLLVLEGHTRTVVDAGLTPDGRRAVSASSDRTLRLWDLETGACLKVMDGHSAPIRSVSVTPDGRWAVSGGYDQTLRLWDLETGTCLRVLEGHTSQVNDVAIAADGRRALSGAWDTARLWDLESGTCLWALEGNGTAVDCVALAHNGQQAVMVYHYQRKDLVLCDMESGTCLRRFEGHTNQVNDVALALDGRRAISASSDNTLRVWDLETGACLRVLEGHTDAVFAVALTPDGRLAASGGDDRILRVWDVDTGSCVRTLPDTSWIRAVALAVDGRRGVSGGLGETLRVWNLESGVPLPAPERHDERVEAVAFTPNGRRAISAGVSGGLRVWDPQTGECLRALDGQKQRVTAVALTVDGRRAILGTWDAGLRVWDLEADTVSNTLEGYTGRVDSMVVTPDRRRVVSTGLDGALRVWDPEASDCLLVLRGHAQLVSAVSLTPDGRWAISGSADRSLRVWDVETGECLKVLEGHGYSGICTVSVTPDGRRAVSAGFDDALRVWDLETGTCLMTLEGQPGQVNALALTPDGQRAISSSGYGTLSYAPRVWNLETGTCERVLEGHTGWVRTVTLTPDGQRAISVSGDKTLRVWDVGTGECTHLFPAGESLEAVAVSQTGILAGTVEGQVVFLRFEDPLGVAQTTATRLWLYGERGRPGHWDRALSAPCLWCGERFLVTQGMLNTDLLCSSCKRPLRLSPFVCDLARRGTG